MAGIDRGQPGCRADEPTCFGGRRMRVKLCIRCPYKPRDLAGHYDPNAVLYACAKCDANFDSQDLSEAHRRQQWSTIPPTISMIPRGAAPFATDDLVSSATTP